MDTDTLTAPVVAPPATELGDHDRFTHIVFEQDGNAAAKVLAAQVLGLPIEALCGKLWVPSRDPERFPLCPTCEAEMKRMVGS